MVQVHLGPLPLRAVQPRRLAWMSDDLLSLADWRRRVTEVYARIRVDSDPIHAWTHWTETRDRLFKEHPQSPLQAEDRQRFEGLNYFDYDPSFRALGRIESAPAKRYDIETSGEGTITFTRFAIVGFELDDRPLGLELYWLAGYGGGIYLPFRDATNGADTYGAGRYLLDTVKGADLGADGEALVIDFNFAYNPSCAYNPRWVCPLVPPENRLDVALRAGELRP